MKIYIRSSKENTEEGRFILYHGNNDAAYVRQHLNDARWNDLGLHCGTLKQAKSHGKYIFELEIAADAKIVSCKDEGDWNSSVAISNILKCGGVNMPQQEVTERFRNHHDCYTSGDKSIAYGSILLANNIDGFTYMNVEDEIHDQCYCFVNMDKITSAVLLNPSGEDVQLDDEKTSDDNNVE